MAFDVYPTPQTATLDLNPGALGLATPFSERRSAEDPPKMYLRVALVNNGAPPTFKLKAGAGADVTLPALGAVAIFDQPAGGNYVGDAWATAQPNGVYQIQLLFNTTPPPPVNGWTLTIVNNDAIAHKATFVVADSDAESQQPWIDAALTMDFQALINETGPQTLRLFNYGTGALNSIAPQFSGPDAASFTAAPPMGASAPPSGAVDIPVTLQAVGAPKKLTATLTVGSNDATAKTTAGHNNSLALTATIGKLEIAFLLDASGSMALDPDGQSKFIGVDNKSTRWGKLRTAMQASLDLLKNMGADKGNFAVGVYPDITPYPADPKGAYGGPFPVVSPSAADFAPAKPINEANVAAAVAAIDQHFPRVHGGATPIGAGIAHCIGSTSVAPWGYFDSANFDFNRRWLILMTDGNHNSGPPHPSDFLNNGAAGQGFVPKKIQVAALGYGNTGAPVEPVNTALLQQIVGGAYAPNAANYHYAQADASPDITAKFLKPLLFAGLTLDSLADPSGVLTSAHPKIKHSVFVNEYDSKLSFIVAWSAWHPERLIVRVRTPLGELIEMRGPDYVVDVNPRYRMLTFDRDFLTNKADPDNPRHGQWTLFVELNSKALDRPGERDREPYDFQIIADTGLKLKARLDRSEYRTGMPIKLSARLDLQGIALAGAAVQVAIAAPANSYLDWLAHTPSRLYGEIAERLRKSDPDIDAVGIKQIALIQEGLKFDPVTNTMTLPMLDPAGVGAYEAILPKAVTPGDYQFMITAAGALPDGSPYRRETALSVPVVAQADRAGSLLQIDYLQIVRSERAMTQATLTFRPRDADGHCVFIDPATSSALEFEAHGADFVGKIVDHHDGGYSRVVVYPKSKSAVVMALHNHIQATAKTVLIAPDLQHFADELVDFQEGHAAAPGANRHADPTAALGDCTRAPGAAFVALGAHGAITLGFSGRVIVGKGRDTVTVYVKSDDSPRAYAVEAMPARGGSDWVEIGRSPGVTRTFGLTRRGHAFDAKAVRIRDLSGVIRAADGSPSASPGISILGLSASTLDGAANFHPTLSSL